MADLAATAVARVFRDERAAVLATLIRYAGDFQLAEDAVQDAFASALQAWRRDGVPDNPGAWITVAARRRAIDLLRRDRSVADRAQRLAALLRLDEQEHPSMTEPSVIADDRLRLIFTCCHPALDMAARVALTLRTLGGLTTGEIARAFLVAEPTMGKRVVRAKRKIADAHIPYRVPTGAELPSRLSGVLRVVYLIFNEGYSAATGDRLIRGDLCSEAVRLGRLLCELMPEDAEAWGLLALMLLHDARRAARVDEHNTYVALPDQDRSLWDRDRLREGLRALEHAARSGPYQLQAAITALHMQAPSGETAPWARIAELYAALGALSPSPVVKLNHAAAAGFAYGPQAGLMLLGPLLGDPALERYQPLHAAHAELLRRAGDRASAAHAYQHAIMLTGNAVERAELTRRLEALTARRGLPVGSPRHVTGCPRASCPNQRGRCVGLAGATGGRPIGPWRDEMSSDLRQKATATSSSVSPLEASERDVLEMFDRTTAAWADGDVDAFVTWYADHATVIFPGIYLRDKASIQAAMADAFAGPLKNTRRIHQVQSVRFLGDAAAAVVTRSATVFPGEADPAAQRWELATWALSWQDGRWLVEAYQSCPATAS